MLKQELVFVEQPVYIMDEMRDGPITTMKLNIKKEIKDIAISRGWIKGKHKAVESYDVDFECIILFKDHNCFEAYKKFKEAHAGKNREEFVKETTKFTDEWVPRVEFEEFKKKVMEKMQNRKVEK